MMTRPRSSLINVLIAFLVLIVSCEGREQLTGRYRADANNRQPHTILLELMADGRGSWSVAEDNVSFKWEIRKKEIWLHTKAGGVIVGKIVGETIEINLPSVGKYHFKRIKR